MLFLNHWSPAFKEKMQGGIPTRYVSLDVETSGLDHNKDIVTQIGFTIFLDGKFDRKQSIVIDWTKESHVSFNWLRDRITYVTNVMHEKGIEYAVPLERMQKEGMAPSKAFSGLWKMLQKAIKDGYFVAGHNLFFDETILEKNYTRFGFAKNFGYGPRVYDTMGLERANLNNGAGVAPKAGETIRDYFDRLRWLGGAKVKTSLDKHCAVKYQLATPDEMNQAHDAEFDSYLVHLLIECWRKKAESRKTETPVKRVTPQRNF